MHHHRHAILASLMVLVAGTTMAGPVEPPAGPVGPTMKTLDQVEPRTPINAATTPGTSISTFHIAQSGSYYLTGNVQGTSGKAVILIDADDVSIDLNGFTISGGSSGISAGSYDGITIRNGTVRDGENSNVYLSGIDCRVIDVISKGSQGYGLRVSTRAVVRDCTVSECNLGILLGSNCIVQRTVSQSNADKGFLAGSDTHFIDCTASANGLDGFSVGAGSMLDRCSASYNGGDGIRSYNTSSVVVSNCNTTSNAGDGIDLSWRSTVRACSSTLNDGAGIRMSDDATIEDSQLLRNGLDGIIAAHRATITDNSCNSNGTGTTTGAGILVSGEAGRIEGNHLNYNDIGLNVTGNQNMVMRNTARGNAAGNFTIASGNELAAVVVNPGSDGFATAREWSNFSY